jgi:spore germination protein KC
VKTYKSCKWAQLLCLNILLVGILTLPGCWSVQEINNLAIVNVMGIDQNDAGEVEVTAVIVKPHTLFSQTVVSGGAENQQSNFLIETATGKSIFQAVGRLSSSVPERIYFGHMNVIVFGEQAARERMESSLDFFKREIDFRPNIQLLVTKGAAARMIKSTPQLNILPGLELQDLVRFNRFAPTGMVKDISQFANDFSSNTIDAVTGVIQSASKQGIEIGQEGRPNNIESKTQKNGMNTKGRTSTENQQDIPQVLSLTGTAVFKGAQLKGFLDEQESRGLLWIQGELKNEIVVLHCGENDKGTVSLNVSDTQAELSPRISKGTPKMAVNIQVNADIGEFTCSDNDLDSVRIERLNKQLEDQVHEDISDVLNKAKNQWQTDIFGFGKAFYRKLPKEWNQLAPQWRNGQLRKLPIEVKVSANISRYGLLKDPIKANESR